MTKNDLYKKHIETIKLVGATNYYEHILKDVIARCEVDINSKDFGKQVIHFWNQFWWELPDTPHIRTATFFKVCEMAELEPEDIE